MEWRYPHPTRWNRRCPALLSEILPKFEMQAEPSAIAEELYNLSVQMTDVKVRLCPLITSVIIGCLDLPWFMAGNFLVVKQFIDIHFTGNKSWRIQP